MLHDFISWKTRKVYEQSDIRLVTTVDLANEIFYSIMKNADLMLLETARQALMSQNIKWLLTRLENYFKSNQICFYSNLGKVFQLPEFQAKLSFKRN